MRLRIWVAALLMVFAVICILAATEGSSKAAAQPPLGPSAQSTAVPTRTKTVDIKVTQFTWQLISIQDKKVVCEVVIEHDGTPDFYEALSYCPIETLQTEIDLVPTSRTTETPQPTPSIIDETILYKYFSWKYKNSFQVTRKVSVPLLDMIVNVSAPPGEVTDPYVILTAYEPAVDYKIIGIRGIINSNVNFTCDSDHCKLPIQSDSFIEVWAVSSLGDESKHLTATVRVNGKSGAYTLTVTIENPLAANADACSTMWGLPQPRTTSWAALPFLPQELNTSESLDLLTGKLIKVGLVKAGNCPGGGLFSYGSPNGCGMETARPEVTQWQNQFDPVIWLSARSAGIPAKLLKTLIKIETQFWPATGTNTLYEFGLGQLNYLGLDTALRWDPELFNQMCNSTLYNCAGGYAALPPAIQAQLKGAMMNLVDSSCSNCTGGINLANAQQAIPMLAQSLRANCKQTQYIIENESFRPISYDDMWRYTLVSYHSGYQCLDDAVSQTRQNQEEFDWDHVSSHLTCNGAKDYVNNFWQDLMGFTPVVSPEQVGQSLGVPVIATQTPNPLLQPSLSTATLHILVYLDKNNDGKPEPDEMVNGLTASITFSDGTSISQVISNGESNIPLSSHQVGSHLTISIKTLFYFYETQIPASGEIPVTIRLTQPVLPPVLP
ncbi:MAG: hypothetical protein P4L50_02790 [Anaerolineaceae bacterium]|nr:hypothetical protein [Anaerolineaceae bacterium]